MAMPLDPATSFVSIAVVSVASVVALLFFLILFDRFDPWILWRVFVAAGIVTLLATYLVYSFYFVVPARTVSIAYYNNTSGVTTTTVYVEYSSNPYINWLYVPAGVGILFLVLGLMTLYWSLGKRAAAVIEEVAG